jgi:hypothetical protein
MGDGLHLAETAHRTVRIWFYIFFAAVVIYMSYGIAVRVLHTFDQGDPPGAPVMSERWNFFFVGRFLSIIVLLILVPAFYEMLIRWDNSLLWMFNIVASFVALLWLFSFAVYISAQAGAANQSTSFGNPFNDYQWCAVCWLGSGPCIPSPDCRLAAAYAVPLLQSQLQMNPEGIFMLLFHWAFVVMMGVWIGLWFGVVKPSYLKGSDELLELTSKLGQAQQQQQPQQGVGDTGPPQTLPMTALVGVGLGYTVRAQPQRSRLKVPLLNP